MVAKKKSAKTPKSLVLKWDPRWIKDPPPLYRNLDQAIQKQLIQAKTNFANQVKTILKQR